MQRRQWLASMEPREQLQRSAPQAILSGKKPPQSLHRSLGRHDLMGDGAQLELTKSQSERQTDSEKSASETAVAAAGPKPGHAPPLPRTAMAVTTSHAAVHMVATAMSRVTAEAALGGCQTMSAADPECGEGRQALRCVCAPERLAQTAAQAGAAEAR